MQFLADSFLPICGFGFICAYFWIAETIADTYDKIKEKSTHKNRHSCECNHK